jgi:hypothetical protein
MQGYRLLEERLMHAIAVQFNLDNGETWHGRRVPVMPDTIRGYDRAIMAWEIGRFCTNQAWHDRWTADPAAWRGWWGDQDAATAALAGLVPVRDHYVWGPRDAEAQWGARAAELGVSDGQ